MCYAMLSNKFMLKSPHTAIVLFEVEVLTKTSSIPLSKSSYGEHGGLYTHTLGAAQTRYRQFQ